jgi:hypothetical protein
LPRKLEQFELAAHARDLLDIPRVVAVEPPRLRRRPLLGEDIQALRHARRLRFPGTPRLVVLYDPRQYHLARCLCVQHEAELWYSRGGSEPPRNEGEAVDLSDFHQMASELAAGVVVPGQCENPRQDNQPLRDRLVELEIISSRPFVPGARAGR